MFNSLYSKACIILAYFIIPLTAVLCHQWMVMIIYLVSLRHIDSVAVEDYSPTGIL